MCEQGAVSNYQVEVLGLTAIPQGELINAASRKLLLHGNKVWGRGRQNLRPVLAKIISQVVEVLDEKVGLGFNQVLFHSQAIGNGNREKSCPLGHLYILRAVAHDDRSLALDIEFFHDLLKRLRMWLTMSCAVSAQDNIKVLSNPQAGQNRHCKVEGLVGDDGLLPLKVVQGF